MYKIVKEIDKLGRIVLPKNIRQHLKVKLGDSVCLEVVNENVVMSKNNTILNVGDFCELICESIYEMSNCTCLVVDNENVVCASGITKNIIGKKVVFNDDEMCFEDKKMSIKEKIETDIIHNQKSIGKIIVLSKEKIEDKLKMTIDVISRYIGKLING